MEQFILSKFLLNHAGCCNILLNRNFAAEIVGRMQEPSGSEIDFSDLRCGAIWALAVDQVYLGGPETPIRAGEGSRLAEISAIQETAPPDACRRVSLEIDFSCQRGGAISALAVDQGCLCCPET